jgi:hypothetical protein
MPFHVVAVAGYWGDNLPMVLLLSKKVKIGPLSPPLR